MSKPPFAPEEITIIRGPEGQGAVYSPLDDKKVRQRKVQYALGSLLKDTDKLTTAGVIRANSKVYKNEGYRPKITKGTVRWSHRQHEYRFMAPDGVTYLPLLPDHFNSVFFNCDVSKGKITTDCILLKEQGFYYPVAADSAVAKKAKEMSFDATKYISTKDLNQHDQIIVGGDIFEYIGLYSFATSTRTIKKPKRLHVIRYLERVGHNKNKFKLMKSLSKQAVLHKRADATKMETDYTLELMSADINWGYQRVPIAAKTNKQLHNSVSLIEWRPGPKKSVRTSNSYGGYNYYENVMTNLTPPPGESPHYTLVFIHVYSRSYRDQRFNIVYYSKDMTSYYTAFSDLASADIERILNINLATRLDTLKPCIKYDGVYKEVKGLVDATARCL